MDAVTKATNSLQKAILMNYEKNSLQFGMPPAQMSLEDFCFDSLTTESAMEFFLSQEWFKLANESLRHSKHLKEWKMFVWKIQSLKMWRNNRLQNLRQSLKLIRNLKLYIISTENAQVNSNNKINEKNKTNQFHSKNWKKKKYEKKHNKNSNQNKRMKKI